MEKLLSKILEKIKKDSYLFQTWEDLLYMSKEAMKEDIPLGVKYLKAKLVALGYEESLADETAEAMADGNLEKVFANQKKHLSSFEKRIRAEALKDTPKPTPDGDSKTMTLEKLRKMSPEDRLKFSQEHAEEYKELYTGGKE